MYGVMEQQEAVSVSTDSASINFLTESYVINGVSYTAADIIDKPGRVGAGGLEILDEDPDGIVTILGPLLAALVPLNWTIVLEYFEDPIEYFIVPLVIQNEGTEFVFIDRVDETAFEVFESSSGSRTVQATADLSAGVHRLAITRTDYHMAISVDGSAVGSSDVFQDITVYQAAFGGFAEGGIYSYGGCMIRTLDIMAPVDDSDLPALSA